MENDYSKIKVQIAVALSEDGAVQCWEYDSSNLQKLDMHNSNLDSIRKSDRLWSVKYFDLNVTYPIQFEGEI